MTLCKPTMTLVQKPAMTLVQKPAMTLVQAYNDPFASLQ
jgi:hypothetical protein